MSQDPQDPQDPQVSHGVDAESPARVIWVADDGTGDYTKLSTAFAAITDAAPSKPYVIKIAPGIYTETAPVVLKNYVDVEGSGQDITTIELRLQQRQFRCVYCGNVSNGDYR